METNHVKLIERYLNNDLTRAQQMEFEHRLTNAEFREKVLEQARLMDTQEEVFEQHIKNDILHGAALIESKTINDGFFKRHWRKLIGAIGVILGMLLLAQFMLTEKETKPVDTLYADYFMHMPADMNMRGLEDNKYEKAYYDGMEFFAKRNYDAAIASFDKQTKQYESSDLIQAICYGKRMQVEASFDLLLPLLSSKNPDIQQNAEWYFLVNKMHKNELSKKDGLLQKLMANDEHEFHSWAKRLQLDL